MTGLDGECERTWVEVNLGAIETNVAYLERIIGPRTTLIAVVKADAYGHGAVEVTKACLKSGVRQFAVATVGEGVRLRRAGICTPILVLGVSGPKDWENLFRWNLTATVSDWQTAQRLSHLGMNYGQRLPVHVKVDTGMGRLGVLYTQGAEFAQKVAELPGLVVEGMYSHLSCAEEDAAQTERQLSRFRGVMEALHNRGLRFSCYHIANSAGTLKYPESRLDAVRVGLALYGLYPDPGLVPALSWKARVCEVKEVPGDWGIGYGHLYRTACRTRIGVIPVGYADGYTRRVAGKAKVLINGQLFPVVGNICMDQLMVELGDAPVDVGDTVVLIGRQGEQVISAQDLATWSNTISYEVVCAIGQRVPRCYSHSLPAAPSPA